MSRGQLAELGAIDAIVEATLAEDLGSGDLTSRLTVPPATEAQARIVAKQTLVVCGGPVVTRCFERVDPEVHVELLAEEGEVVEPGTQLIHLHGRARALLAGERAALNLFGRGCAVATQTRRYVDAIGDPSALRVVDTRKTMPGLRALDRYAVRCGGGHNHRNDLGAGVLIKENHIHAAGSITKAITAARRHAPHSVRIECEVESLDELREAIAAGAEALLLDNMDDATLAEAVDIAGPKGQRRVLLEVSGGVTLERLPSLARIGLDLVSVGALTHSAPAVDLSMRFELP